MKILSKILFAISILLCSVTTLTVYNDPAMEKISFNKTKLELTIDTTEVLKVYATPNKITLNKLSIKWSSSDENIVKVSDGYVKGVGVGKAVVTAIYNNFKTTCDVEVVPIDVTQLALSCEYTTIHPQETMQMRALVQPNYATFKDVVWKSSNKLVATISDSGLITGLTEGQTTITAISRSGVIATKTIYVRETIEVQSLSLSINAEDRRNLQMGSYKVKCNPVPANADVGTISWNSSNSEVISVDDNGQIIVKKDGSSTVTATTQSGDSADIKLIVPRVEPLYMHISTTPSGTPLFETIELKVGKTVQLYVVYKTGIEENRPPTVTEVEWTSSDSDKAAVDQNGLVSGVSVSADPVTISVRTVGLNVNLNDMVIIKVIP